MLRSAAWLPALAAVLLAAALASGGQAYAHPNPDGSNVDEYADHPGHLFVDTNDDDMNAVFMIMMHKEGLYSYTPTELQTDSSPPNYVPAIHDGTFYWPPRFGHVVYVNYTGKSPYDPGHQSIWPPSFGLRVDKGGQNVLFQSYYKQALVYQGVANVDSAAGLTAVVTSVFKQAGTYTVYIRDGYVEPLEEYVVNSTGTGYTHTKIVTTPKQLNAIVVHVSETVPPDTRYVRGTIERSNRNLAVAVIDPANATEFDATIGFTSRINGTMQTRLKLVEPHAYFQYGYKPFNHFDYFGTVHNATLDVQAGQRYALNFTNLEPDSIYRIEFDDVFGLGSFDGSLITGHFETLPLATVLRQTVDEGGVINYTILHRSPEGSNATWSILSGQTGDAAVDGDGRFTWGTGEEHGRDEPYEFVIEAPGHPDNRRVTLQVLVNDTNVAPRITVPTDHTVLLGTPFVMRIDAEDPDIPEQTLRLSYVQVDSMTGATISGDTLTWMPTEDDIGNTTITVQIQDDYEPPGSDTAVLNLNVKVPTPPHAPDELHTTEEEVVLHIRPNVTDADHTARITAVSNGTLGDVAFNGTVITYAPYEDLSGRDILNYTVTDIDGLQDTGTLTIDIISIRDAPTLLLTDRIVPRGQHMTFLIPVHAPNSRMLDFSVLPVTPGGEGARIYGDRFSWTPGPDAELIPHLFRITATDGPVSTYKTFAVRVVDGPDHLNGTDPYHANDDYVEVEKNVPRLVSRDDLLANDLYRAEPGKIRFGGEGNVTVQETGGVDVTVLEITEGDVTVLEVITGNATVREIRDGNVIILEITIGDITLREIVAGDAVIREIGPENYVITPDLGFVGITSFTYGADAGGGASSAPVIVNVTVGTMPDDIDHGTTTTPAPDIGGNKTVITPAPNATGNGTINRPAPDGAENKTMDIPIPGNNGNGTTTTPAPDAPGNGTTIKPMPDIGGNKTVITPAPNATGNGTVNRPAPDGAENKTIDDSVPGDIDHGTTTTPAPDAPGNGTTIKPMPDIGGNKTVITPAPNATGNGTVNRPAPDGAGNKTMDIPRPGNNGNGIMTKPNPDRPGNIIMINLVPGANSTAPTMPSNAQPAASSYKIHVMPGQTVRTDPVADGHAADPDGTGALRIDIARGPLTGSASASGTVISYTADDNASGTVEFVYSVTDGAGATVNGTITAVITTSVGVPPVLAYIPDAKVRAGDVIEFAATAYDRDGEPLTFGLEGGPAGATINATTGDFVWAPDTTLTGAHTFAVVVSDKSSSDRQNVTVTVTVDVTDATNQDPTAPDVQNNARLNALTRIAPDTADPDGDDPAITNVTGATRGDIDTGSLPSGTILYRPNQAGIDRLVYDVEDGRGGTASGTITIYINEPGNARPALAGISDTGTNVGINVNFTADAADANGDPLTFDIGNAPEGAAINATTGYFSWTPVPSQNGTHVVTIIVHDDRGGASWQDVTITVLRAGETNRPPVPEDITTTAVIGEPKTFQPRIMDPDGDTVTMTLESSASRGTILDAFASRGILIYVGTGLGPEEFAYTLSDGRGGTATGTIRLEVVPPANISPILGFIGDKSINALQTLRFNATATDIDSTTLTFDLQNAPAGATITRQGEFSWTPAETPQGRNNFTVIVSDDAGGNDTETITVNVRDRYFVNAAPIAPDTVGSTAQDTPNIVRPQISDPDDDPVLITTATGNTKGEIVTGFLRAGIVIYRPDTGQTGIDTITYTVSDGSDKTATGTMTIFINENGNRNPVLAPIGLRNINAGEQLTFDIMARDRDPISYLLAGAPAEAQISEQGAFSWTPTAADVGNHTFTIAVYDDRGGSNSEVVTVRVLPAGTANGNPTAPPVAITVNTDSSTPIAPEIGDPDGDQVGITGATGDGSGTIILSAASILYIAGTTPGSETVTYTVEDARGATSTGTITITIQ